MYLTFYEVLLLSIFSFLCVCLVYVCAMCACRCYGGTGICWSFEAGVVEGCKPQCECLGAKARSSVRTASVQLSPHPALQPMKLHATFAMTPSQWLLCISLVAWALAQCACPVSASILSFLSHKWKNQEERGGPWQLLIYSFFTIDLSSFRSNVLSLSHVMK